MLRRVLKYISDECLLGMGERVLVGLSGGMDSVALFDILMRGGFDCVVANCNFHLRGAESDRDTAFVRDFVSDYVTKYRVADIVRGGRSLSEVASLVGEYCKSEVVEDFGGVRLYRADFDTERSCERNGCGIEEEARNERYRWFFDVAKRESCSAVAVGHHGDDQAETVLMHILRGTGLRGLCGMDAKSYIWDSRIALIRPFLCVSRADIAYYVREVRGLRYVEDSSNGDERFRRNRVRAFLGSYSAGASRNVVRLSERVRALLKAERENLSGIRIQASSSYCSLTGCLC